ncbi:unnamed protein product [Callosobruchus maculatus]|uniref:G-patch domain-containing protein n=2 Tax=Callosobruchus maculatus TaxID=64391 RepID=A0A653BKM0_CALMS|nr:unnamed protein product [Callosobruchus maculatus]
MSDDEMEKFEITDYDLENEFNINRPRKKLSKHHQIYGIWADDSDNEDNGQGKFKNKKPKNYTAPIGFVAGGIQQAGKDKEPKVEKNESDDDDDYNKKTAAFKRKDSSDSEDEIPVRAGFGSGKATKSSVTEITGEIAGLRRKGVAVNQTLMKQGVGNWEKHTKGIGAKLLLQMGFQPGKGLGKDLQGIAAPVEAQLRKGRGAIGAYGPEKAAKIASIQEDDFKIDTEGSNKQKGESKWKKNDVNKKTRYYYRSVDDVIEKGKRPGAYRNMGNSSELAKVKVIDMTGPQQRVLSGYHALSGLKPPDGSEHYEDVVRKTCSNFTLPEIQHNLDLLVDMCEQDIIRIDRNSRMNEDRIIALKHEEKSLKETIKQEERVIENMKHVTEIVDKLMDPTQGYSLGQIAETFAELQETYSEEYNRFQLGELAPGLIGTLLTSALVSWNPLTHPGQYTEIFAQWKELLADDTSGHQLQGNNSGIQPYDSLIWHTWMPVMRNCISTWSCRDCDPLITLIDTWKQLLPHWILEYMFDQLIMPKILKEVEDWNPLTDTIPIHIWIHPWIPLLDAKLQASIYPLIQEKLGNALTNWHPSDRSAKLMLQPWQRALSQGSFVAFLLKHIVPKLQLCMQAFVINPHQQHLDQWNWVMDWQDMLSVGNMTLILDKFFFPRWLQILAMWLNQNPNYSQVMEWYSGWKRMLSEELLNQPNIKENFHKALEMMNRAVSLGQQPGAKESISYLKTMEENGPIPPPPPPRVETIAEAVKTASQIPQGFKDLVMKRCEERGILFVPIVNKYHEAKQVYRLGSGGLQCYIDRNVIFYCQNGSTWLPTSLNRLLDMA